MDESLPLALVVTATKWDEPPRMRHDVTKQLLRFANVVFVEFLPAGRRGKAQDEWRDIGPRLKVLRPSDRFCENPRLRANLPWIHSRGNRRYTALIAEAIQGFAGRPRLLFNFVYEFPEIMKLPDFDWTSYFCFDEFPRMQRRKHKQNPLKAFFQEHLFQFYENQVARRADFCFTPHYPLRDKLQRANSNVKMLFHAQSGPIFDQSEQVRKERGQIDVGFAGYINYRIMIDWLVALGQEPNVLLHLIGPQDGADLSALAQLPNVKYTGPLSGEEYHRKLREMDVLVMPYDPKITEVSILTTNSKIFQYIAAGKPIVISDLQNYVMMPRGVFYRARTAEEFVEIVQKSHLEDCEEFWSSRRAIAAENTWDKRGEQLHGYLKEALGDQIPDLV